MAARVDSCFVCGASGQASTSGQDSEEDEAEGDSSSLAFTVLTSISFKDRSLCFKQGGVSELTIGSWCLATARPHACHDDVHVLCAVRLRKVQSLAEHAALSPVLGIAAWARARGPVRLAACVVAHGGLALLGGPPAVLHAAPLHVPGSLMCACHAGRGYGEAPAGLTWPRWPVRRKVGLTTREIYIYIDWPQQAKPHGQPPVQLLRRARAGPACRQMLLLELMVHMAGINGAPEQVQSDPDTLAVWMQELYSRAYALCVAARCGCQRAKHARLCRAWGTRLLSLRTWSAMLGAPACPLLP